MFFSDNVTLQLDGILYYRVEDPYQVKCVFFIPGFTIKPSTLLVVRELALTGEITDI